MKLRISESDFETMRRCLRESFVRGVRNTETGCILFVNRNSHGENPSIVVRTVIVPDANDFDDQSSGHLTFSAQFLRRALLKTRLDVNDGFLTVHTHPMSDDTVRFSHYDDSTDPGLMRNLTDLQPDGLFGSIVAGKNSFQGRVWSSERGRFEPLNELVVIGQRIDLWPLTGAKKPEPPTPSAIFDRAMSLTDARSLASLSKMRVAVVGNSGTGSLVAEALLRAGVGELLLFDFDFADQTNLNRVLHLRVCDAEKRTGKANRLKQALDEIGLPTKVTVVECGDIREATVAAELRGCDAIFGCVDNSDWARLVMSETAYQYLIPYIDVGTEIGVGKHGIQSLDTRVSFSGPNRPCLACSGIIDTERVRLEGLAPEERQRVIAMGYSTGRPLSAPAVMDLNMRAASYGVLVLRHLLQPFLEEPLPTHFKEALTTFSSRKLEVIGSKDCPICGLDGRHGVADRRLLTVRSTSRFLAPLSRAVLGSVEANKFRIRNVEFRMTNDL